MFSFLLSKAEHEQGSANFSRHGPLRSGPAPLWPAGSAHFCEAKVSLLVLKSAERYPNLHFREAKLPKRSVRYRTLRFGAKRKFECTSGCSCFCEQKHRRCSPYRRTRARERARLSMGHSNRLGAEPCSPFVHSYSEWSHFCEAKVTVPRTSSSEPPSGVYGTKFRVRKRG